MNAGRRDIVVIMLAVAGLIGAISLAGIFVVYLIDTVGNDNGSTTARSTTTTPAGQATTPTAPADTPTTPTETPAGDGATPPAGTPPPGQARLNRIPDNQAYETFSGSGYSILHPKGWAKSGAGASTTFTLGLNYMTVTIADGGLGTPKEVLAGLKVNKAVTVIRRPQLIRLDRQKAIKGVVQQKGAKGPAGTPIRVFIDQYRLSKGGKVATVDLATTGAVRKDNADDFLKIIQSFRWQ